MKEKGLQKKIAKKIVIMAKNKAFRSVGRSIPLGMHEVEVPIELMKLVTKYEDIE